MPKIGDIGSYRIEMHPGRERRGCPHVHVVHEGSDVVVNLLTLEPYGEKRFRVPRTVQEYPRDNQEQLLGNWDEYYGQRD